MTTFAILSPPDSPQLPAFQAAIERVFPGDNLLIGTGQYVATKKEPFTSEEVGRQLGANGEIGQFVVFTVAGHFGWHRKNIWEWLKVRGTP